MKKYIVLLAIFISILTSTLIFSQSIPQTINYQGLLKNASGVVVANGDYNLTFKLYDVESGGSPLWAETKLITILDGIINTQLGSVSPITLPFDTEYWLGITIAAEIELSPRIKLASVPYSFTSMNVPDASLTAAKIANGQIVKSINSLTDNVNLVAGTNITIVPSGNNLTINAAGGGSGSIGGSGTTNYVPVFTNSTTIGNSNLVQDVAGMRLTNDLSNNINPTFSLTRTGTNSAISLSFTNSLGSTMSLGMRTDEKFGISTLNKNVGMDDPLVIDYSANFIGIGTPYPESKLSVNGTVTISGDNASELNRTQTGNANLVPIAYGNVNADGTINIGATTSNVTLAGHTPGSGNYYFTITGENIYYPNYVGIATLNGQGGEINWSSAGGELYIGTANSAGTPTDKPFTFVIYKK
jgi:hypothetical protein